VLVLRIVESLGWVFGCSLGGERWDGKEEEGETEKESIDRWVHLMVFTDGSTNGLLLSVLPSVRCHVTVRLSQFESLSKIA
jgi:hypothetical protein